MKKSIRSRWSGRKPILIAPTDAEHQAIRVASAIAGMPMAHFLLQHGLAAAQKILDKSQK